MTDHLVTPDSTITIAGEKYTLSGSLKTLKAIQHEVGEDVYVFLTGNLRRTPFDGMAKLIKIGIENAGQTPPSLDVMEHAIVDDIGILETRAQLVMWIAVASAPKQEREKKRQEYQEILSPDSPGENTKPSA